MTKYIQETNIAAAVEGQVTIIGTTGATPTLAVKDNTGATVDLSNVASAVIGNYDQQYVVAAPDLSGAQTMTDANNNSIVFLNSNSYDASGCSAYEFEEADGRVYGLYTRTSGLGQEIYYGSAKDSKQQAQLSVYKYAPSWLSGSNWKASYVLGGDANGFCLALADYTQVMNQLTMRYVYVKLTTNSLIDVAGHQYVEITQFVRSWINSIAGASSSTFHVPLVRRGMNNTYVYATLANQGGYIGGFVNDDVTYPFTTAALPASVAAFTPTQITFTKASWYDGSTGSSTALVALTPRNDLLKVYSVTGVNCPVSSVIFPYSNQATTSPNSNSLEVANNGTTEALTIITPIYVYYTNSSGAASSMVNGAGFTFVVSGTGANVTLTYQTPDQHYGQPFPWFVAQGEDGYVAPDETVVSNPATPSTCLNKLPCTYMQLNGSDAYNQLVFNVFYSGSGSIMRSGNAPIGRAAVQYAGAGNGGSVAIANQAKFNWMYPNLNVSPRIDTLHTAPLLTEATIPSGRLNYVVADAWIGPNMQLAAGIAVGPDTQASGQVGITLSTYPAGAQAGNHVLYIGSNPVQCFPARTGEYLLKNMVDAPYRVGVCYPNGGTLSNPVQSFGLNLWYLYDDGTSTRSGATFNVGNFSFDNVAKQWNWPSTASYTYSAAILTQMQQAVTALKTAGSIAGETSRYIELWPMLDSTGSVPSRFLGTLYTTTGTTSMRVSLVAIGLTISGGVISANPADVTFISTSTTSATYIGASPVGSRLAPLYQVWTSTINQSIAYSSLGSISYPGNGVGALAALTMSGTTVPSVAHRFESNAFNQVSLSPQHFGMAAQNNSFGQPTQRVNPMAMFTPGATMSTPADLATSIQNAITNNVSATLTSSNGLAAYELTAIQNNEVLQIGSVSGRLNNKEFNLPSTYYDLTGSPVGTYYVYVIDNGLNIAFSVVPDNTIAESSTSMYVGRVDKTLSGFANGTMVSSLTRFGFARLAQGHTIAPIAGSSIRWGSYPMSNA